MDYKVLALKYRPARFAEMVGQDQVTAVLQGALQQGRIAQAYLFSGPRGCGKTTAARLLAKALNCAEGPAAEPCGACDSCRAIAAGTSLAVVEVDAASNRGIDDIRRIREEAGYSSVGGRTKVYIIDEAHQITGDAANAFLKTLEEPPPGVVFVLATTEPQKIIPTIHSRCQRFAFRLLSVDEIAGRLTHIAESEGLAAPREALLAVARRAEGSMRDGLTLFDQVLASVEGDLTLDAVTAVLGLTRHDHYHALMEACRARDAAAALRELDRVLATGLAPREFALGLGRYLRDLLLLAVDPALLEGELGAEDRERCRALADAIPVEDLLYLTRLAGERADQIRFASQPRILLETLVVEIARVESRVLLGEVLARLKALGGEAAAGGVRTRGRRSAAPAGGSGAPGAGPPPGASETASEARPAASKRRRAAHPEGGARAEGDRVREDAGSAAPATLGDIPGGWGDFVGRVSRRKKSLGSFLEQAKPGPVGEKHFTLLVGNPFHLSMLDTPEHLELMARQFRETYGAGRRIRVTLDQAAPTGERVSRERARDARREQDLRDHADDGLVRDLLERFDGEILED